MDIIRWILETPDMSHDSGKDLPYMGIIGRILVTPDKYDNWPSARVYPTDRFVACTEDTSSQTSPLAFIHNDPVDLHIIGGYSNHSRRCP